MSRFIITTLLLFLSILSVNTYSAVVCDRTRVQDWNDRTSESVLECGLNFSLYSQDRGERIMDFGIPLFRSLTAMMGLPIDLPRYNTVSDQVNSSLIQLFKAKESDLLSISGSSPTEIVQKYDLLASLYEKLKDERFTEEQRVAGILYSTKALSELLKKNEQGRYELNRDILNRLGTSELELDFLYSDMDSIKRQLKEFSSLKEDVNKLLTQVSNINKDISSLRSEYFSAIDRKADLVNQRENGRDVASEMQAIESKIEKLEGQLQFRAKQARRSIAEARHGVTISMAIFSLFEPEQAQRMQIVANSILSISDSLVAISATTSGAALTLGPYAAIAVAAIQLYGALKETQEDQMGMIFDQLKDITKQVHEMRLEMHTRFDRVEDILGDMHKDIMGTLYTLYENINDIGWRVNTLGLLMEEINQKVEKLDVKLETYMVQDLQQTFFEYRDNCLNYSDYFTGEMPLQEYRQCIFNLKNFPAIRSNFDGITDYSIDESFLNVSSEVTKDRYEYSIGLIAKISGFDYAQFLPNPVAWTAGSNAFIDFVDKYPEHKNNLKKKIIKPIEKKGELVNKFGKFLRSNPHVFNETFVNYRDAISSITSQIGGVRAKFLRENVLNNVIDRLNLQIRVLEAQQEHSQRVSRGQAYTVGVVKQIRERLKNQFENDILYLKSKLDEVNKFERGVPPVVYTALVSPCSDRSDLFTYKLLLKHEDLVKLVPENILSFNNLNKGKLSYCYSTMSSVSMSPPIRPPSPWYYGGHKLHKMGLEINYELNNESHLIFNKRIQVRPKYAVVNYADHSTSNVHKNTIFQTLMYLAWSGGEYVSGYSFRSLKSEFVNTVNNEVSINVSQGAQVLRSPNSGASGITVELVDESISNITNNLLEEKYLHLSNQGKIATMEYLASQEARVSLTKLDATSKLIRAYTYFSMNRSYNNDFRLREQLLLSIMDKNTFPEFLDKNILDFSNVEEIREELNMESTSLEDYIIEKLKNSDENFGAVDQTLKTLKKLIKK